MFNRAWQSRKVYSEGSGDATPVGTFVEKTATIRINSILNLIKLT
jgi:hypothetical protein